MARILKLNRNRWDDTVSERKDGERSDLIADFWFEAAKKKEKINNPIEEK